MRIRRRERGIEEVIDESFAGAKAELRITHKVSLFILDSITIYELNSVLTQVLLHIITVVLNLNLCILPWYFLIRLFIY